MGIELLFLLLLNFDQFVHAEVLSSAHQHSVVIKGEVMMIALFSVHRKESGECGKIQERAGLQRVEAALQRIKQINSSAKENGKCTLGIVIQDTCENHILLPSSIMIDNWSKPIIGMIGPATSEEMFSYVHNPPQKSPFIIVGYGATSELLKEKDTSHYHGYSCRTHNNIIRVVPSDEYQVKVIIQIVKTFHNCSAINIIGSSGTYGEGGIEEFKKQSKNEEVCIHKAAIANDELKSQNYSDILNSTVNTTQILVCFCDGDTLRDIVISAQRMNMTGKFVFIATDRWAERDDVLEGLDIEAQGNIFINIKPSLKHDISIDKYPTLTKITEKSENKWLKGFDFNTSCAPRDALNNSNLQCNETDKLVHKFRDPKLPFVIESIDKVKKFVDENYKWQAQSCQPKTTEIVDNCLRPKPGKMPFFPGIHDAPQDTYYREEVDENKRNYDILNYQNNSGVFKWVSLGSWENGKFTWNDTIKQIPQLKKYNSNCRQNCTPGYYIDDTYCCWKCQNCPGNSYTITGSEFNCTECEIFSMANDNKTGCVLKSIVRIYWFEADASMCIIISTLGIVITLLSAILFYTHLEAPIVKYSSPELLLIIFCGMILAYSYSFLLVNEPNVPICSVIKFWTSISLNMIYGPLLVRANRTSRAFTVTKLREPYLKKKYFSTKFLMKLVCCFVVAELLFIGIVDYSVFLENAVVYENPRFMEIVKLFCQRDETNQFISRNLVNLMLLAYCFVYGFKTIKLPDNFYESKYIVSSCGTSIILWIIYIWILSTASEMRDVQISLSLILSMSAFICLVGLIFPKLYIILWRPQQYKTYFSTEKKLQRDLSNTDALATMDISLWEYLGVASRITPDILDESVLRSSSGASAE